MNRARDFAIILASSILVLVGFWGLWRTGIFNKILVLPDPDINTTNIVFEVGKPFRLEKNQTAIIRGGSSSVRISGFVNSPCPEGAQCTWSGQKVNYEIIVDGNIYRDSLNNLNDSPLVVSVGESDFKGYAILTVRRR